MFEHRQHQNPPFLVGERAVWLGSGSGLPQGGHVRWIGKLPGMGPGWTVGVEFDKELPYGGIDGSWCGRQLFQCQTKHGLLVPADVVVKEDSLLRTFGAPPVIHKAQRSPKQPSSHPSTSDASPKAPSKNPIAKPKRTKSQSATTSKSSSQQSLASKSRKTSAPAHPILSDDEDPIRPVVKPVRRNSKKAREQVEFAKCVPRSPKSSSSTKSFLQRGDSDDEEVRHAFQPLPKSAFAAPVDALPIDDSVLKLIASRLPQLSGVNILQEQAAPRKPKRTFAEEAPKVVPAVDLSLLPASAIRIPQDFGKVQQTVKEPEKKVEEPVAQVEKKVEEPVAQVEEKEPEVEKVEEEPKEKEAEVVQQEPEVAAEEEIVPVEVDKSLEEDLSETAEEESESSSAPPPTPAKKGTKAGYFHTAPARPNRHRASVKKRAPLPPISSSNAEEEPPKADSATNSQLSERRGPLAPSDDPGAPPRVPLRRHNSLNGPRRPLSDVPPAPSTEELIYQWFDAIGDAPAAPPRHHARPDPMSSKDAVVKGSPSISPSVSCTSFEDAVAAADAIYSERFDKQFANVDSSSSVGSTTSSSTATFTSNNNSKEGNRKSGGFLSFLKWLRKTDAEEAAEQQQQVISQLPLSRASSTNSLGTVVSAASSFAFVRPAAYPNNNNNNNRASLHYASPTSDTDTYKLRLRQRERSRILDKGLTFKRKYKLKQFACSQETVFSETLRPTTRVHKRQAPLPPVPKNEHYSDFSLPINLEHRKRMEVIMEPGQVKLHRRSVSESYKDKKAGAYCHVRGKRKAPQPPPSSRVLKQVNNFPSLGRNKKRPAPAPPLQENKSRLSPTERQRLIDCINRVKDQSPPPLVGMQGPALVTAQPIVLADPSPPQTPLSPKPWYKRSAKFIPIRQSSKKVEEDLPEVNYARVLPQDQNKRKSMQFQALTKFSDIDKEASALIQNNQQKAAQLLAARNNSYYLPAPESPKVEAAPESPKVEIAPAVKEEPKVEQEEVAGAASAPPTKGLISKFNAMTNISKVTVNSSKAALVSMLINSENKSQNKRISPPAKPVVVEEIEEETEVKEVLVVKDRVQVIKVNTEVAKPAPLYPKLATFDAKPEAEERGETPLPLSIHGVPDGCTLNRQKKTTWCCPRCTLENESWRFTCDACNMWRPSKGQDEAAAPAAEATGVNTVEEASKSIQKLANDVTKEEEAFKKPEPIGPIDWEAELKHYFPGKKSPDEKKPESPTKINARVAEAIKVLEGKKSPPPGPTYKAPEKKVDEPARVASPPVYSVSAKNAKPLVIAEVLKKPEEKKVATPTTFIGGRISTDLKKGVTPVAVQTTKPVENGKVVGSKEPTSPKDVDEMRRARLAFFNTSQEEKVVEAKPPASPRLARAKTAVAVQSVVQPVQAESPKVGRTAEIATDTAGLANISLKEKGRVVVAAANAADLEEKLRIKEKLKELKNSLPKEQAAEIVEAFKKGAIKKSPPAQDRKPVVNKPNKVSSSAQTSGPILKAPVVKEPSSRAKAAASSPGLVKKIITRSPSFKGNGTFLLMGPKDFASIEATKSKTSLAPPEKQLQHVYANIPSPGLVPTGTPVAKPTNGVQAKSPEPLPAASPAPKSPSPNLKVRPGIQPVTVVKVEINAQSVDDEYDEDDDEEFDDTLDDQSSISGPADSGSVAGSVGDSSDVEKLAGTLTGAKGLAEFKADMAANLPPKASNTLAVNRLLRRLEGAIGNGQHRIAAGLARDLARLKINCKVERQKIKIRVEPEMFTVDMYVEDKVSHQGPIPLSVHVSMTVGELKAKVQQEFEIPADCQRWILGKQLASDDNKTLQQHSVTTGGCVVFLYLVAPPERNESASPAANSPAPVVATPPPPQDENRRIVPLAPENQRGPGWYYNFEEDRYSYCVSSDEEDDPEEEPKNVQPLPPAPEPEPREKTPPPKVASPPLALPEAESSEEEEEEDAGVGAAAAFEPTAPPATLTQEKKTGTLQLGWTCPVCTLINPPTRPGCAACTTDRPLNYKIPVQYETSDQEATRLKQEEDNEKAMNEEEAPTANNYEALLALDNMDLVPNVEPFDCPVCFVSFNPGEGTMLRECLHTFCRPCLAHTAQFSEDVEVHCPFRNDQYVCDATLQDREVRALVTADVYEKMQAKSVAQAENKIQNAFHCKTPDCRGWCIFEDNVNDFRCPVCGNHNCLTCQAIHDGVNCKQYQERMTQASETDADAKRTKEMLEEMVERGEALCCPTCKVVLMKKWGCDWLRCSMCKTEICWVTRGHRWGPKGKGDVSGGCKCGINGVKCHPKCNYCH